MGAEVLQCAFGGAGDMLLINDDCRFFVGEKPCRFGRMCEGCPEYLPWKGQVCVIKTAALGDVLRTTTLLPAIERRFPDHKVTWVTSGAAAPLLRGNPHVHEVVVLGSGVIPALLQRKFDLLINLDKTQAECGLAMALNAKSKAGVGMSPFGVPVPMNEAAEYYFSLGLSDDLKFKKNKKTYHTLIREVCALDDKREAPEIFLTDAEKGRAVQILHDAGCVAGKKKIGIVPGAGKVFAHKSPGIPWWSGLADTLRRTVPGAEIVALGGPEDAPVIQNLLAETGGLPFVAQDDIRLYAGVVAAMDVVITGDTMALHIATAFSRPVVALFGPTCAAEIDLFVKGEKILSPMSCAPCYRATCDKDPSCTDSIDSARVAKWAVSFLS